MSRVSVVIPTFNCARYLPKAIDSVLSQSVTPSEVIVVDDGSLDDTEIVMGSYPDVLYIRQENGGPAKARNRGVETACGDYVAFLDADDFWLPEKLAKQTLLLSRYPTAGFAFSVPWNFSDPQDPKVPDKPYCPPVLDAWVRKQTVDDNVAFGSAYPLLLENNCVATSSVIARRAALLELGLFDESMRGYEDYDMWIRLARTYPVIFMRNPTSRYRVQSNSLSGTWESRSEMFYNYCIWVVQKELRSQKNTIVRRALANYYGSYAYYLLSKSRHPEAVRTAIKSLLVLPTLKSSRVLAEASFPSIFAKLVSVFRQNRELTR